MTTLHDFGGVLRRWPLETFFWALTISFHGHDSWLVCEVALIVTSDEAGEKCKLITLPILLKSLAF